MTTTGVAVLVLAVVALADRSGPVRRARAAACRSRGASSRPPRRRPPRRPPAVRRRPGRPGGRSRSRCSRGRASSTCRRRAGRRTLVIVSALARGGGAVPDPADARPTTPARVPDPGAAQPATPRGPAQAGRCLAASPPTSTRRLPAGERTFHLMVRDGDVASASNYLAVAGRLRAVGQRVQVYVDAQDVGGGRRRTCSATWWRPSTTGSSPSPRRTFGQARDVDGDGRFTVLMSSWLTRLAGGRHAVDGFVRGADFDPTPRRPVQQPLRHDVPEHRARGRARTCGRSWPTSTPTPSPSAPRRSPRPGGGRAARAPEEEGWLDEALAHLVEDLHGFSRSNLDYRVSAFLSQPERYRLVVEDYYAADLFRSHGNRGGTYLFLRWCADRFGPALLPALIRSDRRGTANLEAATGRRLRRPLPALVGRALPAAGSTRTADRPAAEAASARSTSAGPLDGWELAGPRTVAVVAGRAPRRRLVGGRDEQPVRRGRRRRRRAAAVAVEVVRPARGRPPGDGRPPARRPGPARARGAGRRRARRRPPACTPGSASGTGPPVRLTALAWEPLVPAADPHAPGFRRDGLDAAGHRRAPSAPRRSPPAARSVPADPASGALDAATARSSSRPSAPTPAAAASPPGPRSRRPPATTRTRRGKRR